MGSLSITEADNPCCLTNSFDRSESTCLLYTSAEIHTATDLNNLNNYQYYLGTKEAPITGGFNVKADYKGIRLSTVSYTHLELIYSRFKRTV